MTSHFNLLMLFIGEERIFLKLGYSCHPSNGEPIY